MTNSPLSSSLTMAAVRQAALLALPLSPGSSLDSPGPENDVHGPGYKAPWQQSLHLMDPDILKVNNLQQC